MSQTQPKSIAFCGPSAVGKSTLVKSLQLNYADEYGHYAKPESNTLDFIPERIKSYHDILSSPGSDDVLEFQSNVVEARKNAFVDLAQSNTPFISDRSAFDALSYTMTYHSPFFLNGEMEEIIENCLETLRSTDLTIAVLPTQVALSRYLDAIEGSSFRSIDLRYQYAAQVGMMYAAIEFLCMALLADADLNPDSKSLADFSTSFETSVDGHGMAATQIELPSGNRVIILVESAILEPKKRAELVSTLINYTFGEEVGK